ncbi:hypothetical protein REPUB_Repub03eG0125900 [Reevesia pubescens]
MGNGNRVFSFSYRASSSLAFLVPSFTSSTQLNFKSFLTRTPFSPTAFTLHRMASSSSSSVPNGNDIIPPAPSSSNDVAASAASPSPSASSAIDFLTLCHRLKTTKRAGWVRRDVQNPESIADHMYLMGLMTLIASDIPGIDRDKCVKMAIVHDIAEAIVGDITPSDGIPKAEKSRREREALDHMCKLLGGGSRAKEIEELWMEYEENSSSEAKIVKDFDKVEMILQALEYEHEQGVDLHEFFQSTAAALQDLHDYVDELPYMTHALALIARMTFFKNYYERTTFSSSGVHEGLGANVQGYSGIASSEQTISKFEDGIKRAEVGNLEVNDDIRKIRMEFDAAKRSFLKIPEALKGMPKTNPEGIYVNKGIRLDLIQVYGFDYDFTLAHYSANLQSLIYDLAKEHMVNEFRYPEVCMSFKYDPSFPIRGLYYDKQNGCLLKLDFFGSIEPDGCFYGRRQLSEKEIEEIYGRRHIGRDQARGLVGLMDFFCFSEACLIADIVQYFVDAKLEFDACYIYEDVNRAIQHVHRSGLVHRGILSDPHQYLVKNGQLLSFLRMLKEKGKKLFLLTNSPYYFVDGGMQFMLQDSMGNRDSWRELFDVVIAKANKPEFYTSEHPFRCYDTEKDTLAFTKVDKFLPNKIYYHGSLKSFLQITKWNGPEVIYFGDHLFSDLRGPSKAGWRTAAIIHELENEIRIQNEDSYRFEQVGISPLGCLELFIFTV